MTHDQEIAGRFLMAQLLYIMRPHCHMLCQGRNPKWEREQQHLKFFRSVTKHLAEFLGRDDGDLYCTIVGRLIVACKAGPDQREELLTPTLAMVETVLTGKLPDYVEWTGTKNDLRRVLTVVRENLPVA